MILSSPDLLISRAFTIAFVFGTGISMPMKKKVVSSYYYLVGGFALIMAF